jgi:hypothetical protein
MVAPALRRTLVLYPLLLALAGCVISPAPEPEPEPAPAADEDLGEWEARAKLVEDGAKTVADLGVRAGKAAGSGAASAFRGVTHGFADPDAKGSFGSYPRQFAVEIRKHFLRFLDVPEDANFKFGKPQRGYRNKGILLGGDVDWQGYLVDVTVETQSKLSGRVKREDYVVRMRDGEIVGVVEAKYATNLKRM